MKRRMIVLVGLSMMSAAGAVSAETAWSEASRASALASVAVPRATLELLAASGHLTVASVEGFGEVAVVVLRAAGETTSFSLRMSAKVVRSVGLVAGHGVVVSAVSGGYLLSAAGEILAFVPDALSASMIHRHRLP